MNKLRERLYEIIFEADTRAGKFFDLALLVIILLSVLLVMLESVPSINWSFGDVLKCCEWAITLLFTIEYVLRLSVVKRPLRYMVSFFGIIDLLSVVPTYLSLVIVGSQSLVVIRMLRLLRVFRILKLTRYTSAGRQLVYALVQSRAKIGVFLFFIGIIVVIIGTLMYLIEGPEYGFISIPHSVYWAVVTLTTVGYGDISPQTPLGQFLATAVMLLGYAVIAVPTGMVAAGIIRDTSESNTQVCPNCLHDRHDDDALFCKKCGAELNS